MKALSPVTTVAHRAPNNKVNGSTAFKSISPLYLYNEYEIYLSGIFNFPVSMIIDESPWPTSTLNIGPAIVAVTPISPNPFLVIAMSEAMSPKLLPHANTVRARRACGNVVTNPNSFNKSTTPLAAKLIQATDIKNANNEYIVIKNFGGYVFVVNKNINTENTNPGTIPATATHKYGDGPS